MHPVVRLLALLALATGLAFTTSASAERRVALVIGNADYKETAPLANTRNDATEVAAALERLGFEVLNGLDLDKRGMERLIRQFEQQLAGADVALFFYAGHGVQISGQNYLVPTDARLATEGDVDFESLPLSLVLTRMERSVKTSLVLLDACRDNPLARNLARSMGTRSAAVGQGLAEVKTGVGTLISFSTQPGNVALDGSGRNSPYTTALLKEIEVAGRDVMTTLAAVRGEVVKATGGRQVPWEHTSLLGSVILKAASASSGPAQEPNQGSGRAQSEAAEAWLLVRETKSVAELEAFVRRYGDTFYGDLARARLKELRPAVAGATNILGRPIAGARDGNTGGDVRTDGSYQAGGSGYFSHLRFYDDGTVISVSSTGQAAEIAGWFNKEAAGTGKFSTGRVSRDGNRLVFSVTSAHGTVDYRVAVEPDGSLKAVYHSKINGKRGEETYRFVQH